MALARLGDAQHFVAENQVMGLCERGKGPLAVFNDLAHQRFSDFVGGATDLGAFWHRDKKAESCFERLFGARIASSPDDFLNGERLSFVAPLDHAWLVDEEVFGSKFPPEFGVLLLQSDVDALAVGAVAADGGQTQNAVHEDGMGVGEFSRRKWRSVSVEAQVVFSSGFSDVFG